MSNTVKMDDEREVVFCRICLRTDLTQKYILSDTPQRKFIEKIFKENGYDKDLEEHSFACFECRSALFRSYNFVQKSLRAQKLLYELQEKQDPLTYAWLRSLDRNNHTITSNLTFCEPETDVFQPLDIKPQGSAVKTEPIEPQDNNLKNNDNQMNNIDSNSSPTGGSNITSYKTEPNESQDDNFINNDNQINKFDSNSSLTGSNLNPYTIKIDTVDSSFDPNVLNNSYIEPSDIKTEAVLFLDNNDADDEEYLEYQDPLDSKPFKNKRKRKSSDDSFTITEVTKGNRKKKKNKKPIQERKVTLDVFSSDEEVEKKRKKRRKVVWPAMPIFEERFRSRKNVNYSGLDHEKEKKKKKKLSDDEFAPSGQDSSDESADDSHDSYDDNGKVIKWKEDMREFPMECEECESIITSRQNHRNHYIEMHRDKQYPYKTAKYLLCPECGEAVNRNQLKVHEDKHAGKKTECDVCHKNYCSKTKMLEHKRRVHEASRPYGCDFCEKTFFLKCELKLHIRTHTGEKPFKCHLCDYRVAHKGNIYVHIRQVHQNIGPTKPPKRQWKSRKSGKNDEQDSDENDNVKKKVKKTKENLEESYRGKKNRKVRKLKDKKHVEENGSGNEENSSKRKKNRSKENKRKLKRKVITDSESEDYSAPLSSLKLANL